MIASLFRSGIKMQWKISSSSVMLWCQRQQKKQPIGRDRTITYIDGCLPSIRGSIPAKIENWEGLRIFSYVPTPTKLTNAISKTQLSGPKRGRFLPKTPQMCPFFGFWRVLAVLSPLSELYTIFLCH